jgi:hypothetical protein
VTVPRRVAVSRCANARVAYTHTKSPNLMVESL